jgi:hypothetical protein
MERTEAKFCDAYEILAKLTEYANKNMLAVSGDKIEEDKLHSLWLCFQGNFIVNMSPSLLTYTALGSNSLQLTLRDYVK